jgi:hypothetical protein
MILTLICLLAIVAFICAVAHVAGKIGAGAALLLLTIIELVRCLPLGK